MKRKKSVELDSSSSSNLPPDKKTKSFSGVSFRQKLIGEDPISALQEFLHAVRDKTLTQDVVLEYFEAGGNAEEILSLLGDEDRSVEDSKIIFNTLESIFMSNPSGRKYQSTLLDLIVGVSDIVSFVLYKYVVIEDINFRIMTNHPKYLQDAEVSAKSLLQTHLSSLYRALAVRSSPEVKVAALKLLTVMSTLSTKVAKYILSYLKINFNMLSNLIRRDKQSSTRTNFIYFVLSFIVEGNPAVIKMLLDETGLLKSIFPGLVYDDVDTVELVLATLQKHVLENIQVSKTTKLHAFNSTVLKLFFELFNWKGPQKQEEKKHSKRRSETGAVEVDSTSKRLVEEVLCQFLRVLCGSHKYGVVFIDNRLGVSGKNNNQLVSKVLELLEKPWEQEFVGKLLLDIFASCPDLINSTTSSMAQFLEPRLSPKWFKAIDFLIKVIGNLDPKICLSNPGSLSPAQLVIAFGRIVTPKSIMKCIVGVSSKDNHTKGAEDTLQSACEHSHLLVRHAALNLLCAIANTALKFLEYDDLKNYFGSPAEAIKFQEDLISHLSLILPKVAGVHQMWKQAMIDIENEVSVEDVKSMISSSDIVYSDATDHLKSILSLLVTYVRWWPPLDTSDETDWSLFNNLDFLNDVQKFEGLESMALELLSATGGFILSGDVGLNKQGILKHLLLLCGQEDSPSWRKQLLSIFLKTGLFDGNEIEACVWVYCFQCCCLGEQSDKEKALEDLADFVVNSLSALVESPKRYFCLISNALEVGDKLEYCYHGDSVSMSSLRYLLKELKYYVEYKTAVLSPMIPAALDEMKNHCSASRSHDVVIKYMSHVMLLLLHEQVSPQPLLNLLESNGCTCTKHLQKYLKSWLSSKPLCVCKFLPRDGCFCQLSSLLLPKVKGHDRTTEDSSSVIKGTNDEWDAMFLFRMTIFHMAQMAKKDLLRKSILSMGKNILRELIDMIELSSKPGNILYRTAERKNISISVLCIQSALNNQIVLSYFEPLGGTGDSRIYMTDLVDQILTISNSLQHDQQYLDKLYLPFQNKFLQTVHASLETISEGCQTRWDENVMESFLSHFKISSEDILSLLNAFKGISSENLMDLDNWLLLGPGYLLIKLLYQLCNHKKTGCSVTLVNASTFRSFSKHLCYLEEKIEESSTSGDIADGLSQLERCVLHFLQVFPHLIEAVDKELLKILISSKYNRETANDLEKFFISENENFRTTVLSMCSTHWKEVSCHPDRLLQYLSCILESGKSSIPDDVLMKIYKDYKNPMRETFNKCDGIPSWLENNIQLFKVVIEKVINEDVCYRNWKLLKEKLYAINGYPKSLLDIVFSLFIRAQKSTLMTSDDASRFHLMRIMLKGYISVLKYASNDTGNQVNENVTNSDIDFYSDIVCKALERMGNEESPDIEKEWKKLQNDKCWREFTQLALKVGMNQNNCVLLNCLGNICSKVLINGDSEAVLLCKMTMMHSQFLDIMLESRCIKGELLQILLVLFEKNSKNLSNSFIPILLSSYGATMTRCDLAILKLLKMLECEGINFNQYSPYIWGEMAASFYSLRTKVKSTAFSAFSVLRQPKADQVLDIIDVHQVEKTISNYPVYRSLHSEVPFEIDDVNSNIYDPCFYLPLLSHILAPENPVKVYKVAQSGAFALMLASLGSCDNQVRIAAMHVIGRFYSHLETGKLNKEKKLWINMIDSVRNGFGLLIRSKETDISSIQLAPVVAIFLAKASIVMTQPQHIMFFPLHNFFLAKPALDLEAVPEFFRLFHSIEEKALFHRHWILEVLRDGMKHALDFHACLKSGVFKLLLCCYNSVISDEKSKVLILEVLASAVKVPFMTFYLVKGHGLISWLLESVHLLPTFSIKDDITIVRSFIRLFSSLWLAICKGADIGSSCETKLSKFSLLLSQKILFLHLYLLPKILNCDLNLKDFHEYIKTLCLISEICCKTQDRNIDLINIKLVKNAVQLGKNVLKHVEICEDAIERECYIFPPSKDLLSSLDETSIEALQYLFKFVVTWCRNKR